MASSGIARGLLATLALVGSASALPVSARAEGGLRLEDIAVMLGSPEADEVREAIEASAMLGDAAVVPLIGQRIEDGLPDDLLSAALTSLDLLADAKSADIYVALSQHRSAAVRERALEGLVALGKLAKDRAEPVLQASLSDQDAGVRSTAALGLGELGVSAALPRLFTAFEAGVAGSGEALAKLAGPAQVDRLLGYLGQRPIDSVLPIVLGLMQRGDLTDKVKLQLVAQIKALGTPHARMALERVSEMPADAVSANVRRVAAEAASRIAN